MGDPQALLSKKAALYSGPTKASVKNLMLKHEVVQAVASGAFHIYPVISIARGIEILIGVPAGTANEKGEYAPGAVFGKVQKTLMRYLKQYLRLKALASK